MLARCGDGFIDAEGRGIFLGLIEDADFDSGLTKRAIGPSDVPRGDDPGIGNEQSARSAQG